jgi:hypothetical protein
VAVTKLDGVETADVSLNEGRVHIEFARQNAVTVGQLRRTIRDQGFSPKDATLTLSANIVIRDGVILAVVPGSEASYTLTAEGEVRTRLTNAAGTTVTVQGHVGADEGEETPTRLEVTHLSGG